MTEKSTDVCTDKPTAPQSTPCEQPRRSERIKKLNADKVASVSTTGQIEPKTYKQAIKSPDSEKWVSAMEDELNSIEDNKIWSVVDLPPGRTAIGSKWVYKIKTDSEGNVARYKARLVAQGFTQKYGVDYDEVFAPVTRSATFRTLLSIAGNHNLIVKQYDVKTAFLNGSLKEEIYMKPPQIMNIPEKVLKLHKSLYGLKQAARAWNIVFHNNLLLCGFKQSQADNCLYIKRVDKQICYLIIHVDDVLAATNLEKLITDVISKLNESFEIKDLGPVRQFLSIDVHREQNGCYALSQAKYIKQIATEADLLDAKSQKYPLDPGYHKLEDENMLDSNEAYRKLIGMLLYVSTNSRPDIAASVAILSQRVIQPRRLDMNEVKRTIKYLKSTIDLKLRLSPIRDQQLFAYSDADWAENKDQKSISGMICMLNGGAISWTSRKQNIVSISSTESEYYALSETAREIQWLKQLLQDFDMQFDQPIVIRCDSQSCIKMLENEKFSNRTKHIDVRCHHVKDLMQKEVIRLLYVETENNVADMLTKPLAGTRISHLRSKAHLTDNVAI